MRTVHVCPTKPALHPGKVSICAFLSCKPHRTAELVRMHVFTSDRYHLKLAPRPTLLFVDPHRCTSAWLCTGVDLEHWRDDFKRNAKEGRLEEIADHLTSSALPNSIIVDCTASEAPAALYEWWMRQGIHIVTPNKKLGAGPLQRYHTVRNLTRSSYTHWFYEVRHLPAGCAHIKPSAA